MAGTTRECLAIRVFDILMASAGLVVLGPLMLLIALAIVIESGRPVFFSQIRIGRNGTPFRIHKFRKFGPGADPGGPLLTVRNDPRMTRLGRLLERTKLDELPQFFNVLKGEMSIVGPRPDTNVAIQELLHKYSALLDHKPGIFGPSQVAFRNAGALYPTDVHPHVFYRNFILPIKASLDMAYYPQRTLFGDLVWTIRGIMAVIGIHPTLRQLRTEQIASLLDTTPPPHRQSAAQSAKGRAGGTKHQVHQPRAQGRTIGNRG